MAQSVKDSEDSLDSHQLLQKNETGETVLSVPPVDVRSSPFDKYKPALKTLIPIRPFEKSDHQHPNDTAGLISTATFSWMTVLIMNAFRKPPAIDDLWKLSQYDRAEPNCERFSRLWNEEISQNGSENSSVWRVVLRFLKTRLFVCSIAVMLYAFSVFGVSSFLMRHLLAFVSSSNEKLQYGIMLVGVILCTEVARACFATLTFAMNYRSAIRTRSAMLLFMFRKVLKLPLASNSMSVGELVNLCSNDGDRIFEANRSANLVIMGPIIFIAGAVYCTYLLGPLGLFGSSVFLMVIFLQAVIVHFMNIFRQKAIIQTEARVKHISEIITFIKLIKMYCWEQSFAKKVKEIRKKELKMLKNMAILQSMNVSLAFFTPVLASVILFTTYVLLGYSLNAQEAFTCIAVFNTMSFGLKMMPLGVRSIADVAVTMERFRKILILQDLNQYIQAETEDNTNAMEVKCASFSWDGPVDDANQSVSIDNTKPNDEIDLLNGSSTSFEFVVLKDISLTVPKGSLVGICGAVGAGKSSLISALAGQLHLVKGSVAVNGSLAYVSQQAWIMNETVRENILFGTAFDEFKYNVAIEASGLNEDLCIMQSGDLTEVGERGINLSGGQKQRISLARALYQDCDVYLLDDPLSAVDVHVGKHIFNEAVLAQLKQRGKTVLLVTHQLQFLPKCDQVIVIDHGQITEVSTYEALQQTADLSALGISDESTKVEEIRQPGLPSTPTKLKVDIEIEEDLIEQGKLTTSEERGGAIPWSVYYTYIKAASGWFAASVIILFFALNVCIQQFANLWLSLWLRGGATSIQNDFTNNRVIEKNYTTALVNGFVQSDSTNSTTSTENYKATYVTTSNLRYFLNSTDATANYTTTPVPSTSDVFSNSSVSFYLLVYALSAVAMLIVSILRGVSYMSFTFNAMHHLHNQLFDRILNAPMRFFDTTPSGRIINRFQKDIDEGDAPLPIIWEMFFFNFMSLLFATGLIGFVFPKFLIVIGVIFPILIVVCIMFKPALREMKRLDALTRSPWFAHMSTTVSGLDTIRAYGRSEQFLEGFVKLLDNNTVPCYLFACVNRWLAVRLDLLMIIVCTSASLFVVFYHGIISTAFAGLALTSAFLMSGMLQFTIRLLMEGEARFVSIDRIKYYIVNTDQEISNSGIAAIENWPEHGKLEFRNACMRYRDELPLALKNVSFALKPCEKVGVVGRTGSGKSSLAVSLFRLVELSDGGIWIDGVDIGTISLQALRSNLTIIPQDPVLFTGTIRYNLDPFGEHSDEDLWRVIKQTHLKNTILKIQSQLEGDVSENGSNLSVGERQLMCLARALLRKSKIVVLDEATAAVDTETEKIVQETIQEAFKDCTMLIIAHRLSSVLSCDRVLVLSGGSVEELDSPQDLLNNKESTFAKMIAAFES